MSIIDDVQIGICAQFEPLQCGVGTYADRLRKTYKFYGEEDGFSFQTRVFGTIVEADGGIQWNEIRLVYAMIYEHAQKAILFHGLEDPKQESAVTPTFFCPKFKEDQQAFIMIAMSSS